jgi:hypothetical protein
MKGVFATPNLITQPGECGRSFRTSPLPITTTWGDAHPLGPLEVEGVDHQRVVERPEVAPVVADELLLVRTTLRLGEGVPERIAALWDTVPVLLVRATDVVLVEQRQLGAFRVMDAGTHEPRADVGQAGQAPDVADDHLQRLAERDVALIDDDVRRRAIFAIQLGCANLEVNHFSSLLHLLQLWWAEYLDWERTVRLSWNVYYYNIFMKFNQEDY